MFQVPEFNFDAVDPEIFGGGLTIGSLPWMISILISVLIVPFALMLSVRLLGSDSSYGQCFMTWLLAIVIVIVMTLVVAFSAVIGAVVVLIAMILLVFVLCCYMPKFVADRHSLSNWFMGLIAIILAMIFNWLLGLLVKFVFVFIPNIQIFTI